MLDQSDTMPKLSVIIPAYNAAKYIVRAIESVLRQDCDNLEVVIVDDGSKDNTENVLREYAGDKRIKYLKTENKGVSYAINRGLKEMTGDYACFLHADDLFLPGKIKKQLTLMQRFPQYGISYTGESYFLEGTDRRAESQNFHFSGDIFYFLKRSNFIHMSTVMLRKKVLGSERLDEALACHEEWDLFLRLSAKGVKFLYLGEILSSIRVHSENLSFDTGVMNRTRHEVGTRAKALWKEFKDKARPCSAEGLLSLKRYVLFKTKAALIGFPKDKKFNKKSPREILNKK